MTDYDRRRFQYLVASGHVGSWPAAQLIEAKRLARGLLHDAKLQDAAWRAFNAVHCEMKRRGL